MQCAKLAKITVEMHWEEVWRRYDPAAPWDRGQWYYLTNNSHIRERMYGILPYMDQAIPWKGLKDQILSPTIENLTRTILDGVRANMSAYKRGLWVVMNNRQVLKDNLRAHAG